MPAHHDGCGRHWGRCPKASREGTRERWAARAPASRRLARRVQRAATASGPLVLRQDADRHLHWHAARGQGEIDAGRV